LCIFDHLQFMTPRTRSLFAGVPSPGDIAAINAAVAGAAASPVAAAPPPPPPPAGQDSSPQRLPRQRGSRGAGGRSPRRGRGAATTAAAAVEAPASPARRPAGGAAAEFRRPSGVTREPSLASGMGAGTRGELPRICCAQVLFDELLLVNKPQEASRETPQHVDCFGSTERAAPAARQTHPDS